MRDFTSAISGALKMSVSWLLTVRMESAPTSIRYRPMCCRVPPYFPSTQMPVASTMSLMIPSRSILTQLFVEVAM